MTEQITLRARFLGDTEPPPPDYAQPIILRARVEPLHPPAPPQPEGPPHD